MYRWKNMCKISNTYFSNHKETHQDSMIIDIFVLKNVCNFTIICHNISFTYNVFDILDNNGLNFGPVQSQNNANNFDWNPILRRVQLNHPWYVHIPKWERDRQRIYLKRNRPCIRNELTKKRQLNKSLKQSLI